MTPSLALVVIARDAADTLGDCLRSARDHVDRLLVLDTGSRDDTVAVARREGAEVHHMTWVDDFSAARNRALDLAGADWHLVLDADERLVAGAELLPALIAGAPTPWQVRIDSAFDAPEAGPGHDATGRSWITRLLPGHVRYAGRIHEQPQCAVAAQRSGIVLSHSGYRREAMAAKQARNLHLLTLSLNEHPHDPYLLYQLGKSLEVAEAEGALQRYREAWAGCPVNASWRHDLLIRYLHALGQAGHTLEALALAEQEQPAWLESPDFYFVLGNLCLDQGLLAPQEAMTRWLPLARAAWQRCLAIGERPDLSGSVAGRGSWLARHNLSLLPD